ncbi:hypothetical protein MKA34_23395 [[Clostridium] innocuum]|uniref:Uncharacterized protein n=1 Tax=Clostridium innocuum TaxID=1522 RepID=A0AAP2XVA8_CLOIN|nr:hypothetical protein [[Clostridium] innocuum]MCR0379903.1 hypothetical protein [[Clostridium] innocuum]MCR0428149.1 hypothetical protein [[Clostridium] innocuum]MCR0465660.1 hypothetical protein [[Clostridium] innocuum]
MEFDKYQEYMWIVEFLYRRGIIVFVSFIAPYIIESSFQVVYPLIADHTGIYPMHHKGILYTGLRIGMIGFINEIRMNFDSFACLYEYPTFQ